MLQVDKKINPPSPNMWKHGKEIEVNKSSLVDLKAELFRRKAEYERDKLDPSKKKSHEVNPKSKKQKEEWVIDAKNSGVAARAARDLAMTNEERNKSARSQSKLEEKAKLYELMKAKYVVGPADDGSLVDFEQKRWQEEDSESDSYSGSSSDSIDSEGVGIAGRPISERKSGEVWVEYEDDLGRTRTCRKGEFPSIAAKLQRKLKRQQKREHEAKNQYVYPDTDTQVKQPFEEPNKVRSRSPSLSPKAVGPLHFQEVFGDEIRQLGVGYYGFSKDPDERYAQMEALNTLREQTKNMRERSTKLSARKQEALKRRLAKVRERKKLREKLLQAQENEADDSDST
eukprot:CFRG6775T1